MVHGCRGVPMRIGGAGGGARVQGGARGYLGCRGMMHGCRGGCLRIWGAWSSAWVGELSRGCLPQIICLDLAEEMALPKLESFNGQQKIELPVTENVQTIPPPYVVRTILVFGRPGCQPQFSMSEHMKKMLQCPYFFFDVVYIHNGVEEKDDETSWKEMYAFFSSLDTKGTNYKYEVSLTGPAVELHNCMAKLLAHPLQRPFQTHAAYSLLEEDEPPEIEATV
uniref:Ankyrin repeat and LEM domain containing 1 n=1 Tax=Buteo japonicus TaxID=224669 RepID=A0A8C0BKV7_9AVES